MFYGIGVAYSTTVLKPNSCRALQTSSGDKPAQSLMSLMTDVRLDINLPLRTNICYPLVFNG